MTTKIHLQHKCQFIIASIKALRNWKLTIRTKRLWQLRFLSFVNIND